MDAGFDLAATWVEIQARLPRGWSLESLQCASASLAPEDRSDDWVAVATGPGGAERRARAGDPIAALVALAASLDTQLPAAGPGP